MNSSGCRAKSRDPIDSRAADREHHDAVCVEHILTVFVGVGGERGLAVGASRYEPDPVEPAVEWGGREEAADLSAALEPLLLGRHREERVVGEQRDDPVEVDRSRSSTTSSGPAAGEATSVRSRSG